METHTWKKKIVSRSVLTPPHLKLKTYACWAQTEFPSGCGAASPSQGPWDPDSLRPALSLGARAQEGLEELSRIEGQEGQR